MADFVTPNLGYTEPENGGSVNTWGVKLNANLRKQDLDVSARVLRAGDVMSGALGVVAGTEAAPGVFISGDTNSGFYSPAADMVGIATGGVGRFILSNTLLSLAVGLTVAGATALAGVTVSGNAVLGDAAGDTVTINGTAVSIPNGLNFDSNTLFIDSTNNRVGVGTNAPGVKLDVSDALALIRATSTTGTNVASSVAVNNSGIFYAGLEGSAGNVLANGTTAYAGVVTTTGNYPLQLGTNNSVKLTIDPAGNAGLGASPVSLGSNITTFDVAGSSGGGIRFRTSSAGNSSYILSSATSTDFANLNAFPMRFIVDSVEAARITSGRDLLVGTTTAAAGAAIDVRFTSEGSLNAALFKSSSGTGGFTTRIWNADTVGDNLFTQFLTEGTATNRGSIDYNRAGGLVRYNTTSDQTLKTLIGDAPQDKSLSILRQTQLREYYWNDDPTEKPQIGPFAQELHQTYPGAVSVGGFYDEVVPAVTEQVLVSEGVDEVTDEEGNVLIPAQDPVYETVVIEPEHTVQKYRPWGVDKTAFSFHLVAGFQYLDQQVSDHQQRFEALEARLAALEAA